MALINGVFGPGTVECDRVYVVDITYSDLGGLGVSGHGDRSGLPPGGGLGHR